MVPQGDDDALAVRFEKRAIYMKAQSEKENRPIYEDRVFAIIPVPGGDEFHGPIKEEHKQRFWRQWEAFEAGDTEQIIGTPLAMWSPMSPAQVETFKYMKVHTVEQLAALSDSHIQELGMGAQELRRKAKAYLDISKDAGLAMQQAAENERLTHEIEALKQQMIEMQTTFMRDVKPVPAKEPPPVQKKEKEKEQKHNDKTN